MYKEKRLVSLTCVIMSFLLLISLIFASNSVTAIVVWSDDFNDGNYDGWTVTYGTYSTTDYVLRAELYSSCINHPSSLTEGTWSFDIYVNDQPGSGAHVCFICEDFVVYPYAGYVLKVSPSAFELMFWGEWQHDCIEDYFPPSTNVGWYHVDITRDDTGQFRIYIDGTLRIEAVNTTNSVSNYFHFLCGTGEAIDNVVVSDSIDITPTTPTIPEHPTIPEIPSFLIVVLALVLVLTIGIFVVIHRRR